MLHARLSGPVQHLCALSYDHAEAESAHGIGCSLSDLAWQHRVAALPASSTCLVFVHADQVARVKVLLRSERRITHVHDWIERFDAERHGRLLGDALAAWLRHALQQHGYVAMQGLLMDTHDLGSSPRQPGTSLGRLQTAVALGIEGLALGPTTSLGPIALGPTANCSLPLPAAYCLRTAVRLLSPTAQSY